MNLAKVKRGGFSLIEIIFAIAMLGIGIVGILSLFTTGMAQATKAQNSTAASLEVQSLVTRILTEVDTSTPPKRIVLEYIHKSDGKPTSTTCKPDHEWIQFTTKSNKISFGGSEKAVLIDENRDLYWKCRVAAVHSDRDSTGSLVDWYPPLNPDDPLDTEYKDKSKSPLCVNGLFEIAIAIYRSTNPADVDNKKPIAVYTTLVTAGF